jgi:hypothetical protein
MKLKKKEKRLLLELIHHDLYAQEQVANVTYDQKRVDRLKRMRQEIKMDLGLI